MRVVQNMGKDIRNSIPKSFLVRNEEGGLVLSRERMYRFLIANDLLPRDATKEIEDTLVRVARRDRVGVADLLSRGLVRNLGSIGITSYEFEHLGPVGDAEQHMRITALGDRDRTEFFLDTIPVPVTSSTFGLDARDTAGGARGQGVDTTNVEEHTRAVERKLEQTLVNGGDVTVGGNSIPGYTDFGARMTVTLGTNWDDLTEANRDAIVTDVISCRTALRDNGFDGPYMLYVPANYDGVVDDDYKPEGTRTVRERILAIDGVEGLSILPSLADDNVLLVQMTQSVVQAVIGQEITAVTWDLMGGLATEWAIMAVMSFALKKALNEDETEVSGIAHLS